MIELPACGTRILLLLLLSNQSPRACQEGAVVRVRLVETGAYIGEDFRSQSLCILLTTATLPSY